MRRRGAATKRTARIHLTATESQQRLFESAAARTGVRLAEFILESAEERAGAVLASEHRVVLSRKAWNALVAALNRPARPTPALRRLMREPSILERQESLSLPGTLAKRVRTMARTLRTSSNPVLVDLIETELHAKQAERERFLSLAQRYKETADSKESERLREELADMLFGE